MHLCQLIGKKCPNLRSFELNANIDDLCTAYPAQEKSSIKMLQAVSNLKELHNLRIFVHELTPSVIKEVAAMLRSLKYLKTFKLDYQSTAYAKEPLPDLTNLA